MQINKEINTTWDDVKKNNYYWDRWKKRKEKKIYIREKRNIINIKEYNIKIEKQAEKGINKDKQKYKSKICE